MAAKKLTEAEQRMSLDFMRVQDCSPMNDHFGVGALKIYFAKKVTIKYAMKHVMFFWKVIKQSIVLGNAR